ncbi:ribosome small subunit-dependent GTPase A [Gemmatimonadota bacterium]
MSKAGGIYKVYVGRDVLEATLRGRFKQQHKKRIFVGDHVTLNEHADGSRTIEDVSERKSLLRRRSPGKSAGERIVAANIDQVVVVGAARRPDWNPHLIDRFIAVAEANALEILVVVNKCDLVDDASQLAVPYIAARYPVILTSVPDSRGLEALRTRLDTCVSLLSGPTGVGKSSLLNVLQPGLRLRTAEVSAKSGAGRHTTVAAEMHPFGTAGFVVDTPGLRDIGLWGLGPDEVAAAFPEFSALAEGCRFDNCRHLEEPGCVVLKAIENGELAKSRHESYQQLLEEAFRAARPWRY